MKTIEISAFVKSAMTSQGMARLQAEAPGRIASVRSDRSGITRDWGNAYDFIVNRIENSSKVVVYNGILSPVNRFNEMVRPFLRPQALQVAVSSLVDPQLPFRSPLAADPDRLLTADGLEQSQAESAVRERAIKALIAKSSYPALVDYDLPEFYDLRKVVSQSQAYLIVWIPTPEQFIAQLILLSRYWTMEGDRHFNEKLGMMMVKTVDAYISLFERSNGFYGKHSVAVQVDTESDVHVISPLHPQIFGDMVSRLADPISYENILVDDKLMPQIEQMMKLWVSSEEEVGHVE